MFKILDVLQTNNIQATFFVQTHVEMPRRGGTPEGAALMARAFAEGHSVQIHTGSDGDHVLHIDRVDKPAYDVNGDDIINKQDDGANALESDLIRARARIMDVTGQPSVRLVRAPEYARNPKVKDSYRKQGFTHLASECTAKDGKRSSTQILKDMESLDKVGDGVGTSPARAAKKNWNCLLVLFHDINATTSDKLQDYINKINEQVKKYGARPVYSPLFRRKKAGGQH